MKRSISMEKRLKDVVEYADVNSVSESLNRISCKLRELAEWAVSNIERSLKSVLVINICNSTADYVFIASQNASNHISITALATRSVYELNLRLRHILLNEDNLSLWQTEFAVDKIEFLDGFCKLKQSTAALAPSNPVAQEINRLKALLASHGLQQKKPLGAFEVAKQVGLKDEHDALFKFYSKLVHPSSYLVNGSGDFDSLEWRNILWSSLQLYAFNTFEQVHKELGVPALISILESSE